MSFTFKQIYSQRDADLTNRFHVAVRLFTNGSQMTPKCGKSKKSGTGAVRLVCYQCFYHILTSSVIYYWTDARQHGIYLLYIVKIILQAHFCHLLCTRWSPKILQVYRTRRLLKARVQPDEQESVRLLTRKSKRLFSGGGSGIGSSSSHCSTRFCKSCFPNASYECENISIVVNITWV